MSEFSESYHLRGTDIKEGVALVQRAGLKGYVFPPKDGWIPIVAEGNSFAPDERITSRNTGILLHYVSAEDHGWSFAVFEGKELRCGYDCAWDDEVRVDDSRYSSDALARTLGADGPAAVSAAEKILHPADIDAAVDTEPARVFAEAMRLPRFEWFAYDYVAHDFHESPSEYEGVIKVAP
jgi:hypothetical protein